MQTNLSTKFRIEVMREKQQKYHLTVERITQSLQLTDITPKIIEQTHAIIDYYCAMVRQCLTRPTIRNILKYLIQQDLPLPQAHHNISNQEHLSALQKIISAHRLIKSNPYSLNNQTREYFGKKELQLIPEEHILHQFFNDKDPYNSTNLLQTASKLKGTTLSSVEEGMEGYRKITASKRNELTRPPTGLYESQRFFTIAELLDQHRRKTVTLPPIDLHKKQ